MIGLFFYLMAFHGLAFGLWQTESFKKSSIACYDILEVRKMRTKALIECCNFCLSNHSCRGVIYDGKSDCTLLTNVMVSNDGPTEAWIGSKKRKCWLYDSSFPLAKKSFPVVVNSFCLAIVKSSPFNMVNAFPL